MYQRMLMIWSLSAAAQRDRAYSRTNATTWPQHLIHSDEKSRRDHHHDQHHTVVIIVSRRVGQVTLLASVRTSCRN